MSGNQNALALIGRGTGKELEGDDGEVGCGGAHHHSIHSIQWEEISVLDHGRGQGLLVKEALHVQMTPSEERFNQHGELKAGLP